jgi:hypothetical protein
LTLSHSAFSWSSTVAVVVDYTWKELEDLKVELVVLLVLEVRGD